MPHTNPTTHAGPGALQSVQRLLTTGARCAQPFQLAGKLHLAVPQFARDIDGTAAAMHAGDSDLPLGLFAWRDGRFEPEPGPYAPGGEDAEYFEIDGRRFLATASIRTGKGPYEHDINSVIYEHLDGRWQVFQAVPTFGAKQWRHLRIGARHFLALAQGVLMPGLSTRHPSTSRLYEWNGTAFAEFQVLPGRWGYNWAFASHGGEHYLAYADHVDPSLVLRWNGSAFETLHTMAQAGGRAFAFFVEAGALHMVFASLTGTTELLRFDGARLASVQHLGDAGGRELAVLEHAGQRYLARICFITGTREAPVTALQSDLFRWQDGRFVLIERFPTFGGTSAAWCEADGTQYLVVANSLSASLRFRTDTVIYRLRA